MTKLFLPLFAVICLSACATLFGNKSDNITVHSQNNARILVDGNEIGRGTALFSLPREKTAVITVKKAGCSDMSLTTEQSVNNTTFLNIFFWPGFIVDAVTGKINEADPTSYMLNPNCSRG